MDASGIRGITIGWSANSGMTLPLKITWLLCLATCVCVAPGAYEAEQRATQRPPRAPDIFFVPTWEPIVYQMLDLARVTRDDVVYDLGSGDGRIVILAAQKYGARGVGIELDPKLVEVSRQVARDAEVADRVTFVQGDLFTANIADATVVTLYLSPSVNSELEPKLRGELRPGTRIVSHQFPIGRWTPEKTVRAEDGTDLFLWTKRDP
jgi:SAM-dependent methyltransferase